MNLTNCTECYCCVKMKPIKSDWNTTATTFRPCKTLFKGFKILFCYLLAKYVSNALFICSLPLHFKWLILHSRVDVYILSNQTWILPSYKTTLDFFSSRVVVLSVAAVSEACVLSWFNSAGEGGVGGWVEHSFTSEQSNEIKIPPKIRPRSLYRALRCVE